MKRILTILALALSFASTAQNVPGSTWVPSRYRWLGGMFNQLKLPAYADTSNVPQWAPWLSGDAMLDTSGGNAGTIYVRYGSPRAWHAVSGSGGSGGGISEVLAGYAITMVNDSTPQLSYDFRDSLYSTLLKISDTASTVAGYVRVTRFLDSLTAVQTRVQTKVAFTDTATVVGGYVRKNRNLAVGYGILGGGDLNANRTFTADTATLFPAVRATVPGATATLSPLAENARSSYRINLSNEDTIVTTGDSFTVQYGVSAGEGWNYIFQDRFGMPIVNLAASGRGAWYAALGANTNITQQMSRTMLTMFGINDIRRGVTTATYKKLASGTRSVIANNLISVFTAADAGTNTFSGTWTSTNFETYGGKSGTFIGGNGKFNNVSGSYIEYTATGSDFLIGYLSNVTGGFTGGNFDVSVDGAVLYHVTADQSDGISDGSDANTIMPGVLFIRGLTNASHTIRVTNSSNNYVYIDYFATVKKPAATSPVLISLLPHLNAAGYATAPANGSDAAFNLADDSLKAVIATFEGWPVRYVPVNEYYSTVTDIQADNIHPNVQGYKRLADAFASGVDRINPLTGATAITTLNGLTGTTQTFATPGSSGTAPAWVSSGTAHTLNLPLAGSGISAGLIDNAGQSIYGEKRFRVGTQFMGALSSPINGGGVEIEYNTTGYISALDRSGTTWKGLIIRALTYDWQVSGSSIGSASSSFAKWGNVSNPNTMYVDLTGKVGINTSTPRKTFEQRTGDAIWVNNVYFSGARVTDSTGYDILLSQRTDSVIKRISWPVLSALINAGVPNANSGSAYRLLQPTAQTIKTVAAGINMIIDSATANTITFSADTTTGATALATQGDITRAVIAASYNPIPTGTANVTSITGVVAGYVKVGTIVDVTFRLQVNATATSTLTTITLPIPIASDFTLVDDAWGGFAETGGLGGDVIAETVGNTVTLTYTSGSTSARFVSGTFKYIVK